MAKKLLTPFYIQGDAPFSFVYTIPGILTVHTGKVKIAAPDRAINIRGITTFLNVAGVGGTPAVTFDLNYNGSSVLASEKIDLATTVNTANTAKNIGVSGGGYFTIDCDLVGSTTPGSDACITIWYL